MEKVVPFQDLPFEDRKRLATTANWKVDGWEGDWETVIDTRYGTIQHIAVTNEAGKVKFDKLNIQWTSGVYVVTIRINPEGKAEFLLPSERRILLRDSNGKQGNVFVDGIPQGVIKEWNQEKPENAARRELLEETGHEPTGLVFLGNIAFSPANSETEQPFYLALIPYIQTPKAQTLEDSEDIHTTDRWFTWNKIHRRAWKDGVTVIGLSLAQRVIDPKLL